jgi:hypothetical protein
MKRCLLSACLALLVGVGPAAADMYSIKGPGGLFLGVTAGGELLFLPPEYRSDDARFVWVVGGPREATGITLHRTDQDLTYDPDGGKREPYLTVGFGRPWKQVKLPDDVTFYTVQAAEGKLAGWYLDVGPAVEVTGKLSKRCTGYRAVLTKKPRKPVVFTITVIAP